MSVIATCSSTGKLQLEILSLLPASVDKVLSSQSEKSRKYCVWEIKSKKKKGKMNILSFVTVLPLFSAFGISSLLYPCFMLHFTLSVTPMEITIDFFCRRNSHKYVCEHPADCRQQRCLHTNSDI